MGTQFAIRRASFFRFHFSREIDEETWCGRKSRYEPLGSPTKAPRRAMVGSPTKVPGDGSAAGSAEREHEKERPRNSDRTSKRRTRRSSSSSSTSRAAAPTTIEPGERSKEGEVGRKKASARDKTKGNGRSVPPDSGSAPVPDVDESTDADDKGGKKGKGRHRRTSDSHSAGSSRRSSVRKSGKGAAIVSSDVVEIHPMVDRASAAPVARASPSSEQGPAKRKRRRSSNSMTTDDENHDGKQGEDEKSRCGDDEKRSNLVADSLVPSQAFPAALHRETLLEDEQPVTPASEPGAEQHQQRIEVGTSDVIVENNVLGRERSCRGGGEERSTSSHGKAHLGRKTRRTRRREEAALKEDTHGTGNDGYGTEEGALGTHRTRSTTEGRPRRNRTTEHESLSTGLGVKVIDGGATKQLVLTVGDAVGGKSGSSSDRSRGANASSKPRSGNSRRSNPAQHVDAPLQHREQNHRRRRRQFPLDPEEQERSRAFRDNFAAAVLAKGEDTVDPLRSTERYENLVDKAAPPAEYPQTPPATPPAWSSEATKDQPGQANHRHLEHPLAFSGIGKAPTCRSTTSPSESPRVAPSFSIVQETANTTNISNRQLISHGPASNKLEDTSMSGGNQGGPSPTPSTSSISSSSSVLGRAVHDRTAKYVTRQASFHDDIPGNYVDLNSPLGEEGGEKNERGTAVSISPANKTDSDPVFISSREPTDTVRGTRRNDHDHGEGVIRSGPAERTRASSNPEVGGRIDLLAALPTDSTDVQAGCLRGQGESGLANPSQQQGLGQRGTRPLSQEGFPGSRFEEDDEVARDLVHFRTDLSRRLASGDRPELFFLRPNESLAITRIEGSGRLLVTVREEEGAAALVAVDGAIVYDSAAHFGQAAVQVGHGSWSPLCQSSVLVLQMNYIHRDAVCVR